MPMNSMNLSLKPALEFHIAELATLMNRAFRGYIGGEMNFTAPAFAGFISRDDIDLSLSQIVLRDDQAIGLALIACRGGISRLAGMGIIPEAQKQGVGKWLMSQLIEQMQPRYDDEMILEVIEQNIPAVKLYQGIGFQTVRRLFGYSIEAPGNLPDITIEHAEILEVAKLLVMHGPDNLPWQVDGWNLARSGPLNAAWRLGSAYAVISDPGQDTIVIRGIVTLPEQQRQGQAAQLLQAIMAHFPHKRWYIPAICPEEYGPLFTKLGFTPVDINQFQMQYKIETARQQTNGPAQA